MEYIFRVYFFHCVFLITNIVCFAEEFYVSTDGSEHNNGTKNSPWHSVEFALSNVGGGNTIILLPGNYWKVKASTLWSHTASNAAVIRLRFIIKNLSPPIKKEEKGDKQIKTSK